MSSGDRVVVRVVKLKTTGELLDEWYAEHKHDPGTGEAPDPFAPKTLMGKGSHAGRRAKLGRS